MTRWRENRRLLALFAFLAICFVSGCGYGKEVNHGKIQVFYLEGATKEEADKLGMYLNKIVTENTDKWSVQLKKSGNNYVFRTVAKPEAQNDPKAHKGLEIVAARISRDVFDGATVELHVCDERLKTLHTLPQQDTLRYGVVEGNIELFYSSTVTKDETQKLLALLKSEFVQAKQVSFRFTKRENVYEVHMVVNAQTYQTPLVKHGLALLQKKFADLYRPANVELHLCGDVFDVLEVIK